MRELGLAGARRGKRARITVPAAAAARPADLVHRRFSPGAPDRLRVADFTYVPAWTGMVYVAFVIDAYFRTIRIKRGSRMSREGRCRSHDDQILTYNGVGSNAPQFHGPLAYASLRRVQGEGLHPWEGRDESQCWRTFDPGA